MREKLLKGLIDHLMSMPDKSDAMEHHQDLMGDKEDALNDGAVGDAMHEMKEHEEGGPSMAVISVEKHPSTNGASPLSHEHSKMGMPQMKKNKGF